MAAKEIVLIAKDKYQSMLKKQNKQEEHVSSQAIPQTENEKNDTDNADPSSVKPLQWNEELIPTTGSEEEKQVIMAPIDKIPGTMIRKQKHVKKKTIKWLPY